MEAKPHSAVVTTISASGFSVRVGGRELFVAFDQFPWFRHAGVSDLLHVELVTPDHLRWPTIDADLSVRSIEKPGEFPLVSRVVATKTPKRAVAATRQKTGRGRSGRRRAK